MCFGDTLYIGNNYYYNSGTYTDTIIVGSCDSIITTFLTINPQNTTYQSINICNGDSIIFLDGPGGTQVPQIVIDGISDYYIILHEAHAKSPRYYNRRP